MLFGKVDIVFNFFRNKEAMIFEITPVGKVSSITEIIIPEKVIHEGRTYTVVGFSPGFFSSLSYIKKLVLPPSFRGLPTTLNLYKLEEINIPESMLEIPNYCFVDCFELKKVIFPKNSKLKFIGTSAFWGCKSLKEIDLPKSLKEIGPHAFRYSGLEKITLPELKLNQGVFLFCKNLKEVHFLGDFIKTCLIKSDFSNGSIFPKNMDIKYFFDLEKILKRKKKYSYREIIKALSFMKPIDKFLELIPKDGGFIVGPRIDKDGNNTYYGNIFIPDSILYKRKKLPILGIDSFAFSGCNNLKSIIIANKNIDINHFSFYDYKGRVILGL